MCGISGALQVLKNESTIDFKKLDSYINTLIESVKLRGPDNTGKLKINTGFLGHTRLAIRDLSSSSNQPISLLDTNTSAYSPF